MPTFRLRSVLPRIVFLLGLIFILAPSAARAQRQSEQLGRAVVALRGVDTGGNGTSNWSGSGINQVYVGWRLLATDPEGISFNVYRSADGGPAVKLNASPITTSTNYVDTTATLTVPNAYTVKPVINGIEGAASEAWTLPANSIAEPCFTIALPALADGVHYVHLAWAGDLDGDGFPDIVIDRLPTTTGTIRVEAYSTRTRARLWSIDSGPNGAAIISSGQNDGVTVYDFDGDGKCEVVIKSIAGTVFGNGAVLPGAGTAVYLSIVDGATGAERSRFQIAAAIADSTDAKNIGVGFLDGVRPALVVMDEAHNFSAYDVNPATFALSLRWKLVSPTSPYPHGHGIRIGDIDGDGKDEVSDIGMAVDDNGTLLHKNELNHGDRYHIADIDPERPGLECFAVQQDNPTQLSYVLFDPVTGQMLWRRYSSGMVDNGRGNIGSLDSGYTGMQVWSAAGGTLADQFGNPISTGQPSSCNFSIWWDGDPLRETLDRQIVEKWKGSPARQLTGYNFESASYSWRDAVPFYGDILGDWREEIVTASGDDTKLVIFSTTKAATSRYYTLLQDPQYRNDLTIKGYMQSHHPGFYFGQNMPRPPRAPVWNGDLTWVGNAAGNVWVTAGAGWKNSATGAAATYADGKSVLFDLSGVSSTAVTLTGTLTPSNVVVHAPKGQAYIFGGPGSLSGAMTLTKGGQGSLTLGGTQTFTGQTIISEGTLLLSGSLTSSAVRVDSRGTLGGTGTIAQAVSFPEARGSLVPGGIGAVGTLSLSGGLSETGGTVNAFDLSSNAAGSNDCVAISGNLTLSGANIIQINPLDGTLAAGGTYTLFTYTGTFTGDLASVIIRGADAYSCTLANTGLAITLTVGALRPAAAVTWNGGTAGVWKLNGGSGWLKGGGVADGFVTGDTATFDNIGSTTPAVTLSSTVLPAATVVSSTNNYTFSGAGGIGGSGGLAKSGTGTLTISVANTYTGPTTINGGVLAVASLADGGQPSPIGASANAASNLVLNGGTLRLINGSTSTFRGATLGASGGTLDLPSASSLLNLSGVITGTGSLTKTGAGQLMLNAVNTYSGGTVIQGGRVVLTASREDNSPTSPIQYGLGTGPVTLHGGTLALSDTSVGDLDAVDSRAFWPIIVPAGASGRLEANGRMNLGGALTGAGDFTFFTPFIRTNVTGDWSAFTGRLFVVTDGDGGDLRIANSAGLSGAWLDLGPDVWAYSRASADLTTMNIGSLSGAAGSVLDSWTGTAAGAHQPAHWRIGARGDDTTFAGIIAGNSIVTKQGPGTLTLTGANTYTGATTVSGGKLVLKGGSLTGTNVTVASGAGFGGNGSVTGNVTYNAGSVLLANPAAGPLAINGNIVFNGAVTVSAIPGATLSAGRFPLFTYTGTMTGSPSFTWSGSRYSATFDTSVPGEVSVDLVALPRDPADIVWTGDQSDVWNSTTTNWVWEDGATAFQVSDRVHFDDSSNVTDVTLTGSLSPASATFSATQDYTLTGAGLIAGSGTFTQSGTGNVTISTANTFTGGSLLSAGTVTFTSSTANANGLGTGPVLLNEGTLKLFSTGASSTSSGTFDNALQVDSGYVGTLIGFGRGTLASTLLGSGTLNYETDYIRADVTGNWSGFTGQINIKRGPNGGDFRINNTNGFGTAKINLAANTAMYMQVNFGSGGLTNTIGELTGSGELRGGPTGGRTMTWNVGGANTNAQFAGAIKNGAGATAIIKSGAGTWTLSGASTHTGTTNVSTGALLVTGSLGSTPVSVASGATIGGTGTLGGNLTLASGARLALGIGASATRGLTVTGTSTLNGAITVVPALLGGTMTPGTYTLLTYTGTLAGSPSFAWNDTTGSGYTATFSTATTGQVKITLFGPPVSYPAPTGLSATPGNGQVVLNWNSVQGATGYNVKVSLTSGGPYALLNSVTGTTYTDTSVTNGTTYYYVVSSAGAGGAQGPDSSQASATPTAPVAPPQLTAAVSRKSHAGVDYDIPIATTASPTAGVECRGPTSLTLVATFDKNVTAGTATVAAGSAIAGTPTFAGATMTIPLTNVANAQSLQINLGNLTAADGGTLATATLSLRVLNGDVNGSGSVSGSDVNIIKAAVGAAIGSSNFRADVNANGSVSGSDVNITKAAVGSAVQ